MVSTALSIEDLRWRGPLLFGTLVRSGERLGIVWYRPGDFAVVIAKYLAPEERDWTLSVMREAYFGHLP